MFNPNADQSPINPLPPVIVILALAIALIEIALQLGGKGYIGGPAAVGWRIEAVQAFGFFDSVFEHMRETRTFEPSAMIRFATYPFVHSSLGHALFAVVLVLAIGKAVGEIFHPAAVLGVFFISAILAAIMFGMVFDSQVQMIGAYPSVYGLLGAFTWMLWLQAGATGKNRLFAFKLAGLLLVFQIAFQIYFYFAYDLTPMDTTHMWFGRFVGFATGFFLSFVLAPDGRERLKRWLRLVRTR